MYKLTWKYVYLIYVAKLIIVCIQYSNNSSNTYNIN